MSIDTEKLIVAFPPQEMANLQTYRQTYGVDLPTSGDRHGTIERTLLGHPDSKCVGGYRAGVMPTTVSARKLTDGRYAVAGHWTLAIKSAWEAGDVQAEILTPDELNNLTPQAEL